MKIRFFSLSLVLSVSLLSATEYRWESVRISGGGNVTSVIFHPKVKDLIYITTDVGTPWRWNPQKQAWEDMMLFDKIPVRYWRWGLSQAALNVAVDPNDTTGNILYAMVENGDPATFKPGMGKGGVLKSFDRGHSWIDCELPVSVQPNYNDKAMANRMAVDPNNSRIIYVTTYENGSFVNDKAGEKGHWTKLNTGLPDKSPGQKSQIKFILLDKSSGKIKGRTKTIYIGYDKGILVSKNGGKSFRHMQGSPAGVSRASIANDGTMYVSYNLSIHPDSMRQTGIAKWNKKKWQNVTPALPRLKGQGYKAIDVFPSNSKWVIASEIGTWLRDKVYVSSDGGKTWKNPGYITDNTEAPHSHSHDYEDNPTYDNNMFGWDPFRPGEVWYADMIDVGHTKNIWADTVHWKLQDKGLEEVIVTGPLVAPPFGKNLLHSATADIGGADHRSLTGILPFGVNTFFFGRVTQGTNNAQAAIQNNNPEFVVRIGSDGWALTDTADCRAGYSLDGGDSYRRFKTYPGVRGRVAVSSDSPKIVWVTQAKGSENGRVFWSNDLGETWTPSIGVAEGILPYGSQWNIPAGSNFIVADKVNGNTFYLLDRGKLYVSTDGGKSFEIRNSGLPSNGTNADNNNSAHAIIANIDVNPEQEGDIWIAFHDTKGSGLYHSADGGYTFEKVQPDFIKNPKWVAVGKDRPDGKVLVYITTGDTPVHGVKYGVFRSDDLGKTWQTIANPAPGVVMNLAADLHGRVFMGISGAGLFYGEPKKGCE